MARRLASIVLAAAAALHFAGCSGPDSDYIVRGAGMLERGEITNDKLYDILAYPLTEDELRFFTSNLDRLAAAVEPQAESWLGALDAEKPTARLRAHPVWEETGLPAADFMAAYAKMDFLSGYFVTEPVPSDELNQRIRRLERSVAERPDAEMKLALEQLRDLARIAPLYRGKEREFYLKHAEEIQRALDRFRSIGEQVGEPQAP